ncbi:hypothetical protein B5C34_05155 [Pacificimonas flava]|uniref:Uncharacterized protein n=2 Tax=Pacificimonas TaxID=1960290 RepID=A0A219B532_9SPHN|nr:MULTISPECIES: hypothetical protein [Pacificimonas]MBZ6377394.1 hypothetical protein [Pacificimonas aurantium]OWV32899.1 hypothetical protein B5C34_05155 [Pacificimonas flava]
MIGLLLFLQLATAVGALFAAFGFRDFVLEAWRGGGLRGVVESPYAQLSGLLMCLILHLSIADVRILFALPEYLAAMRALAPWEQAVVVANEGFATLILILLVIRRNQAAEALPRRRYLALGAALLACAGLVRWLL